MTIIINIELAYSWIKSSIPYGTVLNRELVTLGLKNCCWCLAVGALGRVIRKVNRKTLKVPALIR